MKNPLAHHVAAHNRRMKALREWKTRHAEEWQKIQEEIARLDFLQYQIISARVSGRDGFDADKYKLDNAGE
jgi:hypothetical protein